MRPDQQWTTSAFERNWSVFRISFPFLYQWDYRVSGDVVYLLKTEGNKITDSRNAGYVFDIGSLSSLDFSNHMKNLLFIEFNKERKKNTTLEDQEKREEAAYKKGDMFAGWLLALNPNIPLYVAQQMAEEAAQIWGYNDMKSGMKFVGAVFAKFNTYKEANNKNIVSTDRIE